MAGEINEKALLTGYNKEDGDFFLLLESKTDKDNYADKIKKSYPKGYEEILKLYPAKTDEEAAKNFKIIYNAGTFGYGHDVWSRLQAKESLYIDITSPRKTSRLVLTIQENFHTPTEI